MKAKETIKLTVQDQFTVSIQVRNPLLDPVGKHHTYEISGVDKHGSFEARRRFNDFYLVREALTRRWPGLFIPSLPQKKAVGNKETKFIEDRKRGLDYFVKRMSCIKYLHYSQEYQILLRSKDAQKSVQGLAPPIPSAIRDKYFQIFNEGFLKADKESCNTRVGQFTLMQRTNQKNLKVVIDAVLQITNAKRVFNDNFSVFTQFLMPDYENNILQYYYPHAQKKIIFNCQSSTNSLAREINEYNLRTTSYDLIADLFRNQYNDIDAWLKALEERQNLEAQIKRLRQKRTSTQAQMGKLLSGKTTFKSFFSKGTKDDQAKNCQKQIQTIDRDIQATQQIIDLISYVLADIQIVRYKQQKVSRYVNTMKDASGFQLGYLNIYGQFLRSTMTRNEQLFQLQSQN